MTISRVWQSPDGKVVVRDGKLKTVEFVGRVLTNPTPEDLAGAREYLEVLQSFLRIAEAFVKGGMHGGS